MPIGIRCGKCFTDDMGTKKFIRIDDKYIKLEQQLRNGKIRPQQIINSIDPEDHIRMAWFLWRVYIDLHKGECIPPPPHRLSPSPPLSPTRDEFKEYDWKKIYDNLYKM